MENIKEHSSKSEEILGMGFICELCGNPIEDCNYAGQKLDSAHTFKLVISASAVDAFLPHVLIVHGECLTDLKDMLMEKNKGYTWM